MQSTEIPGLWIMNVGMRYVRVGVCLYHPNSAYKIRTFWKRTT